LGLPARRGRALGYRPMDAKIRAACERIAQTQWGHRRHRRAILPPYAVPRFIEVVAVLGADHHHNVNADPVFPAPGTPGSRSHRAADDGRLLDRLRSKAANLLGHDLRAEENLRPSKWSIPRPVLSSRWSCGDRPRSRRTKKVVWFQVDIGSLDGWYWRYETAEPTLPEPMPVGWLAMNGAMRLVKPVEVTTFLVHPGPGVAFVIPNLMKARNVRAVVGEVPVDRHTGWAITYLRRGVERRPDAERLGSQFYLVDNDLGVGNVRIEQASDYGFEPERWLRSGRLLWIAPGDESATLPEGIDGCPYLDLPTTTGLLTSRTARPGTTKACPADHLAWPGAPTPSGTRPPPRVSLPDADWSVAEPVTGRDCDETAVVVTRLWLDERCGAGIA
jgi:hypothetical protein